HIYARVSTDHGQTWGSSTYKVTNPTTDNDHGHNLAMPVFDPRDSSGNTIYLVYVRYTQIEAGTSNSVQLVKSVDKGKIWSQLMAVSRSDDQVLFEPPSIAIDKSGHLYVG